jgi:nitrogen fixation protein NifU and related proteins
MLRNERVEPVKLLTSRIMSFNQFSRRKYTRMDRQEAIEFLIDHYENPRNYGPLDHADVSLSGGNPGCADIITMHARFNKDGKLEAVNWEGEGCTISSAAASYVTEITRGMTAEEVENLSFEDLMEQLGRELVMTRPTCATLALGTLKKGVHEYHMHQRADEAHYPALSNETT